MFQSVLGSRANVLVDFVLVMNLVAPFWAFAASRVARTHPVRHMWLQLVLWAILFVDILLLEGWIRYSGGSGSLVGDSPYAGTPTLRIAFMLHILPATVTYVAWAVLVFMSFRRRGEPDLRGFARLHRVFGKVVIAGLLWTAVSALGVYYLGFVA